MDMLHTIDAALAALLAALTSVSHGMGKGLVSGVLGDVTNLFFFHEIKEFIIYRIDRFTDRLLGRTMSVVSLSALVLTTIWVLMKGFRIVTGRSQDSMTALVMSALRITLILSVATGVAAGGTPIVKVMADSTMEAIYGVVAGKDMGDDPYAAIDKNLGYMQLAMMSIDLLDASDNEGLESAKTRAQLFNGVGIGGPALIGGTLLLLNRIAMSLVVGFGPIFIMCLMFDQTKFLFGKWLMFGIGTMFSLAVLSVMVSLSLDIVGAVAMQFWIGSFVGTNTEGVSSMALQQGGLGLVMTMLMVTVPPMAASFFQGTLGQFSQVNAFGGFGHAHGHGARAPGATGYAPHYAPGAMPAPPGGMSQGRGAQEGHGRPSGGENLPHVFNRQASMTRGETLAGDSIKTSAGADPAGASKVGLAASRSESGEPPKSGGA